MFPPGESQGQRSLAGCGPPGRTESSRSERLTRSVLSSWGSMRARARAAQGGPTDPQGTCPTRSGERSCGLTALPGNEARRGEETQSAKQTPGSQAFCTSSAPCQAPSVLGVRPPRLRGAGYICPRVPGCGLVASWSSQRHRAECFLCRVLPWFSPPLEMAPPCLQVVPQPRPPTLSLLHPLPCLPESSLPTCYLLGSGSQLLWDTPTEAGPGGCVLHAPHTAPRGGTWH